MSPHTAIHTVIDKILQSIDRGETAALTLLDQRSAFDLIDHKILLKKMELYNYHKDTIKWFRSYLQNRKLKTKVRNTSSKEEQMQPYGTTQGSVLGAILFIIYVNDFPAERKESDTTCYVDDNADITSDKEIYKLEEKTQREATHSHEWLKANGLALSPEKTKLLILATNKKKIKMGNIKQK